MGLWEELNKPAFGTARPFTRKLADGNNAPNSISLAADSGSRGEPIIGASTVAGHIETAKTAILDGTEKLLGAFHGQPLRNGKPVAGLVSHHYLLITDTRVIFWGRGLASNSTDAFRYRDISSVDAHQGMLLGDIVLNVKGAKETFRSMPKADVHVAAKLIRELVEKAQTPPATQASNSIPDQIKKLAELRDGGVLSDAEFQAKKTELLSRM